MRDLDSWLAELLLDIQRGQPIHDHLLWKGFADWLEERDCPATQFVRSYVVTGQCQPLHFDRGWYWRHLPRWAEIYEDRRRCYYDLPANLFAKLSRAFIKSSQWARYTSNEAWIDLIHALNG